jgi:glycogen debranching enzyme
MALRTEIRWSGAPDWTSTLDGIVGALNLPRQRRTQLRLSVRAVDEADPIDRRGEEERQARQRSWLARATRLHAPAETPLATIANGAARDIGSLALLDGPREEWLTPAAGAPLYLSLWGRDALTAAWQAGILDRGEMLEDVLVCLDRLQGNRVDASRDEQPGRIVAQVKRDPRSRLGRSVFERSYADVASPFMFIIGLGYHYALTGDLGHVRRHWHAALRVLDWADRYGDRHGDGYITYYTVAPGAPRHQGWKDSGNAVVDEHGRQVPPPIAPCEIQGYWYVSLQFMSAMALALGQRTRALELWRQAADLAARFNRDFWMEDLGFVAFGLGPDRRPIRALTSNAGQCLPSGIVASAPYWTIPGWNGLKNIVSETWWKA